MTFEENFDDKKDEFLEKKEINNSFENSLSDDLKID